MAQFEFVGEDAKARLVKQENKRQAEYDGVLAALQEKGCLALSPSDGETIRSVRVNLSRAATRAGVKVVYGEDASGALLAGILNA